MSRCTNCNGSGVNPTDTTNPRDDTCKRGHALSGDNLYVIPSTGKKFCRECKRSWMTPARRALYREKYLFGGRREEVIQRDGEKCLHCGMTRKEHWDKYGRDITVDHIDRKGLSLPREEKNNALTNLQTLCLSCHSKKDYRQGRLTIEQRINIVHMSDVLNTRQIGALYGVTANYVRKLKRAKAAALTSETKQQTGEK